MNQTYVHASEFNNKLSELRNELQTQIDDVHRQIQPSIRSELDREIERLKLTIGTAWKVLGVAIAVIVGGATYFSIKTAYDVNKGIEAAANKEVAHRLADDSTTAPFRRVVTKALVDSYLIRLAKAQSDEGISPFSFHQPVELDGVSTEQLLSSLKDPATEEEDFRKIVEVLVRARPSTEGSNYPIRSSSSPTSRRLVSLVKGASPDFGWILNEPSRRAFTLGRLDHTYDVDLISTSKTILKEESDPGLLVAAAQYIEANGTADSAPVLESAFNKTRDDPDVSYACLKALARLQPGSVIVQKRIGDLTNASVEKLTVLGAPALAVEFLKDPPSVERRALPGAEVDPERHQKQIYAERLIRASLAKGLRFTYNSGPFQSGIYASIPLLATLTPIDVSLFTGSHGKELFSKMLSSSAQEGLKQFSEVVDQLSIRKGDFFSENSQGIAFAGRVHIKPSGASFSLATAEGRKLTATELPDGADLEPDGKGAIVARYLDHSGIERSVKVSGVENPKEAEYEIEINRDVLQELALAREE